MRIPNYAINGLGITVVSPDNVPIYTGAGAQPFEGCVEGSTDAAGNSIICPQVAGPDYVPCLNGSGPLGPGQSYCDTAPTGIATCALGQRVTSSCICPTGTALDPTSLMCLGKPSIIPGIPDSYLFAGVGIIAALLILPALTGGGRRR